MTLIETVWTITPALILIAIAFPSFRLLYLLDYTIYYIDDVKLKFSVGSVGLTFFLLNNVTNF